MRAYKDCDWDLLKPGTAGREEKFVSPQHLCRKKLCRKFEQMPVQRILTKRSSLFVRTFGLCLFSTRVSTFDLNKKIIVVSTFVTHLSPVADELDVGEHVVVEQPGGELHQVEPKVPPHQVEHLLVQKL